jgi:hypothetical protein
MKWNLVADGLPELHKIEGNPNLFSHVLLIRCSSPNDDENLLDTYVTHGQCGQDSEGNVWWTDLQRGEVQHLTDVFAWASPDYQIKIVYWDKAE